MIYLDNNATTRLDDKVIETILPLFTEDYANASSIQHRMGRKANHLIQSSREKIANFIGADAKEIYFTSGATEAINTVIKGVFNRYQSVGKHIITAQTEHKDVLSNCESLAKMGAEIQYLPIDLQGNICLEDLQNAIRPDTILVALMSCNNETGVLHPIAEIAKICQEQQVLFFCDATQSIGKQEINLQNIDIDILCFSAHKFHGPKGIGALYIRRKSRPIQIEPLIIGGKQENGFRAGTYNTAAIVGMATALEIAHEVDTKSILQLRDLLENSILETIADCYVHAQQTNRIHNTSNICFKHVKSSELMNQIANIALSSGSACVTGDRDPSHVLTAMGVDADDAHCSIRFSLSKYTRKEEILEVIFQIQTAVQKLRHDSPIWQLYKDGLLS